MHVEKVHIENFKGYTFYDLSLDKKINILVGNNESKKSTIVDAINLVLTGHIDNQFLTEERLNPYLFNQEVAQKYITSIKGGETIDPPEIRIELFFPDDLELPENYEGHENFTTQKHKGIGYEISFNEMLRDSYEDMVSNNRELMDSLPLEYYKIRLYLFSGDEILRTQIPLKSLLIDAVSNNINVSNSIITRIIKNDLESEDKLKAKRFFRSIKDKYKDDDIHSLISNKIPDKETTASIDPSSRNSWDSHLSVYYKEIPFEYVGKGRQSMMKTDVALRSNKAGEAKVILLEEPENHLSHSNLLNLLSDIEKNLKNKQVVITSHSSFVANKLGLHNLKLLSEGDPVTFKDLDLKTENFFKKLPGYDTLRILLCEKAILVEGDADELILQKAYKDKHKKIPIMSGIEVISVNNTYKRFTEIAMALKKKVAVVIDADNSAVTKEEFKKKINADSSKLIDVFFEVNDEPQQISDEKFNHNTLEPLLLKYNDLEKLNKIFDTKCETSEDLLLYMRSNKTDCALKIFESDEEIVFPKYIQDAIDFVS